MACGGEANGVRLLSPSGIDPVFDEPANGPDLASPLALRHEFALYGALAPVDAGGPLVRSY